MGEKADDTIEVVPRLRAQRKNVPDCRGGIGRRESNPISPNASRRSTSTPRSALPTFAKPGIDAVRRVQRGNQPSV